MTLTGPACVEAMAEPRKREEEKERETVRAGTELSGGLDRDETLEKLKCDFIYLPIAIDRNTLAFI